MLIVPSRMLKWSYLSTGQVIREIVEFFLSSG